MADARISELPAATTPLDRTELIEIVQAGLNKQATIDDVVGDVQLSIGQTGGSIWEFEAATTTPPATGKIRFDSATVAAVTNVYISQTSLNGTDVVDFLQSVMVGDSVFIQDREFPDRWFRGKIISGISDNGDWWTIPIHVVTGSGLMVVPGVETIVRFSMNTDNTPPELSWKDPVDMATTGPITLSGEQTIDGQATSTSRVLVKDQANPEFNGLYTSGAGAWTRTTDADTADELEGAIVNVLTGTVNHDKNFVMISDDVILGTTWILWEDLTDSPSIVVPATDTAAGIMKKYGTTGSNTDGTMDQNSITTAIGAKGGDILVTLVTKTASYTLADTEFDQVRIGAHLVMMMDSASAVNIEIPLDSGTASNDWPIGGVIGVRAVGAGQVTVTSAIGVTKNAPLNAFKSAAQNALFYIEKTAANTYYVNGELVI